MKTKLPTFGAPSLWKLDMRNEVVCVGQVWERREQVKG